MQMFGELNINIGSLNVKHLLFYSHRKIFHELKSEAYFYM